MFTGLVEALGEATSIDAADPGVRIRIRKDGFFESCEIGASVALNGCCLTVVERTDSEAVFEAGPETLARTNLGRLVPGGRVNMERSMKLGDQLGGHLVTGHIDGSGSLLERLDEADWSTCWFRTPRELSRQMASKGSVAIDGVSLTLVDVEDERFSVALIPHTLKVTTLGALEIGDPVNLETDVLAKYVERQLQWKANS